MTQTEYTQIPAWNIHDRCRKAREVAGLDQAQLAERIEVSRATISNYETGFVTKLRPIVLRQWALATGVPIEWLRDGESPHPRSPGGADADKWVARDLNSEPAGYVPIAA